METIYHECFNRLRGKTTQAMHGTTGQSIIDTKQYFFDLTSSGSYPAAAAAAAAFAAQNRQVRGKGRGYLGNYPGMLGEYVHQPLSCPKYFGSSRES